MAIFYAGFLFLPAAGIALLLPETSDERAVAVVEPLE
jgi:hypothetical protein